MEAGVCEGVQEGKEKEVEKEEKEQKEQYHQGGRLVASEWHLLHATNPTRDKGYRYKYRTFSYWSFSQCHSVSR